MKKIANFCLAGATFLPSLAMAAAPAVADKADNAFMMICTALVLFMTIPGIALFYGGLIRAKNVLSMLTQVAMTFALVCVLWMVYGYSLAFSEGNAFFGSFNWAMLKNIAPGALMGSFYQYIHIAFQASFACITVGLIVGAVAERIRFSAVLIFVVIWLTFAYLPIAHMVWAGGFLAQDGALDFAGGLWFISTPPLPVWSGLIWWVNVPASAKKPLNRIICRWSLPERQSFTLAGLALTPAPPARLMKLPLLLSSTRLSRPLVRC